MSSGEVKDKKFSNAVYILISLLLLGMMGFGTSQFGTSSGVSDSAVLSAGDAEITQSEYQNSLRSIQQRNPDMSAEQAKQVTLSGLQQRVALSDYINKFPLAASNQQMDKIISQNPNFFDNGKFSDEAFRRVTRVAPEVYRKSLSKDIAMQTLQQKIAESSIISQSEVKPFIELSQLSRDILVAKIARSSFNNTASDEDIKQYYDNNKSQYMTDEILSLSYIDLNPAEIAAKMPVSDVEILAAAQPARKAKYHVMKDQAAVDEIAKQIEAGIEAAELAEILKNASEDSGDLGEVAAIAGEDSLIPQSAVDAIYALDNVGDLTPPINVDGTVYLFELSEKNTAAVSDAEKQTIKTKLQAKKAATEIAELHDKLNTAVFDKQSPNLESIAEATGLAIQLANDLSVNKGQGILATPELVAAIEASDKLINKLQEPVTIDDRVIIYQLNQVNAPQQMKLAEVTDRVKQAVIAEKDTRQLVDAANKLSEQAKEKTLKAAASEGNYPTQDFAQFTGRVDENALLDPIAAMMIMQELPRLGDKNAAVINSPIGDSYVYVTTDIRLDEQSDNAVDKAAINAQLTSQIGQLELNQFLQSITQAADVRLNPALIE